MKLQNLNEGADVIIQLLLNESLYSLDAKLLVREDKNGYTLLSLKPSTFDIKLLSGLNPTMSVGYVTEDNRYILFEQVQYLRGTMNSNIVFAVKCDEIGKYVDRRMFPRFVLDIPCAFTLSNSTITDEGILHDLSRHGAAINVKRKLHVNAKLHLTFFNKYSKTPVNCDAKVVREVKQETTYLYGLELEDSKDLQNMIEALQNESFDNLQK